MRAEAMRDELKAKGSSFIPHHFALIPALNEE
jgi:hypothetical protein